jgi:hypothetical protein
MWPMRRNYAPKQAEIIDWEYEHEWRLVDSLYHADGESSRCIHQIPGGA